MSLVTLDDVQRQMPQLEFSPTTKPTKGAVEQWIAEAEDAFFAALENIAPKIVTGNRCVYRFITPIDPNVSPVATAITKDLVTHAVAARILRARLFGVGDADAAGAKQAQAYYDSHLAALADLENPFSLSDAEVDMDCTTVTGWAHGRLGEMGGGYKPRPRMVQAR